MHATSELAARLTNGGYAACVIVSLGSDGFKPNQPTAPFKDQGPWRDALVSFVRQGGILFVHGERTAAAVLQGWFGKPW